MGWLELAGAVATLLAAAVAGWKVYQTRRAARIEAEYDRQGYVDCLSPADAERLLRDKWSRERKRMATDGDVQTAVGAIVALAGLAWSFFAKRKQ